MITRVHFRIQRIHPLYEKNFTKMVIVEIAIFRKIVKILYRVNSYKSGNSP